MDELEVSQAISNIVAAMDRAEKAFTKYEMGTGRDINDLISNDYPFELSFDEMLIKVHNWQRSVRSRVGIN